MQCPRCGSSEQFSDYIVVGCNTCGYISGPVPSLALAKSAKELPTSMRADVEYFDRMFQMIHNADLRRNSECAF